MEQLDGGRRDGPEEVLPVPKHTSFEFGYLNPYGPEDSWWEVWVIARGIAAALAEYREIDDRTARFIARQLERDDASALHKLAATGKVQPELHDELTRDFDTQPAQVQDWVNWLGFYCLARADKGPVAGWNEPAPTADRADLEVLRRNQAIAHLDDLFGQQADEEIGDVQELGWFGLVRHEARPGGLVLSQDEQGFQYIWETDSDDELQDRWTAVNDEYERFQVERDERERHDQGPHRLADLEERLAPLPDLGEIPYPGWGHGVGSGYEWMEQLTPGWHVESSWGRNGWDLGAWPLIVVALYVDAEHERYAVATYTEGDVDVKRYRSRGALYVAVNEIAEFHWRLGQSRGPDDLPEGSGLLAKHCGPFSDARYERETAAERTRHHESEGPNEQT